MLKSNTPVSALESVDASVTAWGSVAVATVGRVTVELDEALASPDWQLSLDTPPFYLRLRISGPEVITRLHEFLTTHRTAPQGEFLLSRHGSQDVGILRDDESADRFFIVIGRREDSSLRLTLVGEELEQLTTVLADICGQLAD